MLDMVVIALVGMWTVAFIGCFLYCLALLVNVLAEEIVKVL